MLRKLALLLLIAPIVAFGQTTGVPYSSNVTTVAKNVPPGAQAPIYSVPNARVFICVTVSGQTCGIFAPIFLDAAMTIPIAQPIQTDGQGRYTLYVASGAYTQVTLSSQGTFLGAFPFAVGGGGGGSGTVVVNYGQTFTNATLVTLLPTASQLNTPNAFIQCYDASGNEPNVYKNLDPVSFIGTMKSNFPFSGRCVLSSGAGGNSSSGLPLTGGTLTGNLTAPTVTSIASTFPTNVQLIVEGSSISVPYNSAGDAYISASNPGSGYSGIGSVAVSVTSGSCTSAPTVNAFASNGGLLFSQANAGLCAQPTTFSTAISGFAGGGGASVTVTQYPNPYPNPWYQQLAQEPTLKGRVTSVVVKAISGTTILDNLNRFASDGTPALCGDLTHTNYYMIDGGAFGNSLSGNNVSTLPTYDVIFSQWNALEALAHNAGCHVIVATPLLRGTGFNLSNYATFMSQAALLAPLVANSVQSGDFVLDWYHDLGNVTAFPFPQGDQVHPTGAGQQYIAMVSDNELSHGNAYDNGAFQATGYLPNGLSIGGNNQNYQPNGLAFGYANGFEYETITGPSLGVQSPKILRTCDYGSNTCIPIYTTDQQGNMELSNALHVDKGLAVSGNFVNYAPNSLFAGNLANTEYLTVTGNAPGTSGPFQIRQCDSLGGGCKSVVADTNGNYTFPGAVRTGNGFSGFVASVGQFCSGILISATAVTCP